MLSQPSTGNLKSFLTKAQNFETKEGVADIKNILRDKLKPLLPELQALTSMEDADAFGDMLGSRRPHGKGMSKQRADRSTLQSLVKEMATGGPVGTDTVPAVGEFVINKRLLKHWYGKLGKMNRLVLLKVV